MDSWKLQTRLGDFLIDRRIRAVAQFLRVDRDTVWDWVGSLRRETVRDSTQNLELYLLVRGKRPRSVVETGVNRGHSTAMILRALRHNGEGHLTSIDLPFHVEGGRRNADGKWDVSSVPVGLTGCEVPEFLRDRWTLIVGDAKAELPKLSGYDFFFHDSDHSYAHQIWEYRVALEHLPAGGVLASDDINWSSAFGEVSRGRRRFLWPKGGPTRGAIEVGT